LEVGLVVVVEAGGVGVGLWLGLPHGSRLLSCSSLSWMLMWVVVLLLLMLLFSVLWCLLLGLVW
jgi:hypothetical protein